jgi:5-methylcytosine-specific restriction enzyme B
MIDKNKYETVLQAYKKDFTGRHWTQEKFKWEAIQHFQDHWDMNATDFSTMFEAATEKASKFLETAWRHPKKMIIRFAQTNQEATRAMFINLFDERKDFIERVEKFKSDAENMRNTFNPGDWKEHDQKDNPIMTYLWLRYPDTYYPYKYSDIREAAKLLGTSFKPKKTQTSHNLIGSKQMLDEINGYLTSDSEVRQLLDSVLDESAYPDPYLKTLTYDFCFYISKYFTKKGTDSSPFPSDYDPGITVDEWVELLSNSEIFHENSLQIMKRILDHGGKATCTELATKYGEKKNFYSVGSSSLAKRIAANKNIKPYIIQGDPAWWPILYTKTDAAKESLGSDTWKLRDELKEALEKTDLSRIDLFASKTENSGNINYWWLNANPNTWSFNSLPVGKEHFYTVYNENGNKRRIHQNFRDAKPGDRIIAYESNPIKQIVSLLTVTNDFDNDKLSFEKTENLPNPINYTILRQSPELQDMECFANPNGSLFKLTKDEYDFIMDLIRESNPISDKPNESYTKSHFLSEVYMPLEHYESLVSLLENKKNIILKGPPGVGKTFAAKRLAYSIMGNKDDRYVEFIQFHQNYSYEDFIMGYKPDDETFKLTKGIFYKFCTLALNEPDKKHFFIIDEINRGNISKIFGELLMLIEKDYRGSAIKLTYSDVPFQVPKNLYIIGMMNTADRSLAIIDYALRRRFSFFEMGPGFSSDGFRKYQKSLDNDIFDELIKVIIRLNQDIASDRSLGDGFLIGHSYFCGQSECTDDWMNSVVEYDMLPLLKEYWFDDTSKIQSWENELRGVLND